MNVSSHTLIARFFPSLVEKSSVLQFIVLSLLGTMLLTLSAKISIPFYPIPTTMQPLAVIMLGCIFGSRLALATVALYLFECVMGLPVLQGPGAGIVYMSGPTMGYLVGFLIAAYGVGLLSERGAGRTFISGFILFVLGMVLINIPGLIWLTYVMGVDVAIASFQTYFYSTLLKIGLGTTLVPSLWRLPIKKT
jgi:biotin transport system substrate-specific component